MYTFCYKYYLGTNNTNLWPGQRQAGKLVMFK